MTSSAGTGSEQATKNADGRTKRHSHTANTAFNMHNLAFWWMRCGQGGGAHHHRQGTRTARRETQQRVTRNKRPRLHFTLTHRQRHVVAHVRVDCSDEGKPNCRCPRRRLHQRLPTQRKEEKDKTNNPFKNRDVDARCAALGQPTHPLTRKACAFTWEMGSSRHGAVFTTPGSMRGKRLPFTRSRNPLDPNNVTNTGRNKASSTNSATTCFPERRATTTTARRS